jgi:FixJ family two-component response regulator
MKNEKPAPLIALLDDKQSSWPRSKRKQEVRRSISSLLRSAGYRSIVLESLDAFLTWLSRSQTSCLIVNFQLCGLNGLELRRLLSVADQLHTDHRNPRG